MVVKNKAAGALRGWLDKASSAGNAAVKSGENALNQKRKYSAISAFKRGIVVLVKTQDEHDRLRIMLSEHGLLEDEELIQIEISEEPIQSQKITVSSSVSPADVHVSESQWVEFIQSYQVLVRVLNN